MLRTTLLSAPLLIALAAANAALAEYKHAAVSFDRVFDELRLTVQNTVGTIHLSNTSQSPSLSDLAIEPSSDELVFEGVSGILKCASFYALSSPKHILWPQDGTGNPTLSLGRRFYDWNEGYTRRETYETLGPPAMEMTLYKRQPMTLQKYSKLQTGTPIDASFPLAKLANPEGADAVPIDPLALLQARAADHVEGGGTLVDFYRSDQVFVLPSHLTLGAGCVIEEGYGDWGHYGLATVPVEIRILYSGDTSLQYEPALALGGTGGIQLPPPHLKSAEIAVTPPNSSGICPRPVTAKATLALSRVPQDTETLDYRFLENAAPATAWQSVEVSGTDSVTLHHKITVEAPQQGSSGLTLAPSTLGYQGAGAQPLDNDKILDQKPTVAIEARLHGSDKTAVAMYTATCQTQGRSSVSLAHAIGQLPDLTARDGIRIGAKSTDWGGTLELEASDAIGIEGQGCRFRFGYGVANAGKSQAGANQSCLHRQGQGLHIAQLAPLMAGGVRSVTGNLLLPAGSHPLALSIDDGKLVVEADESNNAFQIRVTVPEACSARQPTAPRAREPRATDPRPQ